MQDRIVEWYHCNLQHAGINWTVNSIGQVFDWKGLRLMVEKYINSWDSCQRNKTTNKKSYGKIPLVPALRDKNPWEVVHINCCGPWKVKWRDSKTREKKEIEIHLLSIVDTCTGWSEFVRIDTASSIAMAAGPDKNWLCHYPRPHKVVHDNGPEFMGCKFQEMLESYGITSKPTTVKNPMANAVVERIHGTLLGEQLRSTVFESNWSNDVETRSSKRALMHFVQHCQLEARTRRRSSYSDTTWSFGRMC
jgi:transposase InsO family protein